MNRSSTLFWKVIIVLIALGAIVSLAWFPQTEGRAQGLDLLSIYSDPLIIYGFIASIPFFTALYHAYILLGYLEDKNASLRKMRETARNIKYSAIAFIAFLIGGVVLIRFMTQGDDPAGPTMLGLIAIIISSMVALAAHRAQKILG